MEEKNNKRELIVRKVDKFVFNANNLDKIIAIFLAIFLMTFCICCGKRSAMLDNEQNVFNQMRDEIKAYQKYVMLANLTPNNGQSEGKGMEAPKYKNAKEATLDAFNKLENYEMYEIDSKMVTTAVAVGQNVEIVINSNDYKYQDGMVLNRVVRKETKTNFGQTDAVETIYTGTQKYNRKGSNIRLENGKYVADFSGDFAVCDSKITKRAYYELDKASSLFSQKFSFVRDKNGKIAYYEATVLVGDPNSVVKDYATEIQEAGGTTFPDFSYLEISSIIDRDGNLISYTATEKMTFSKKIVIDITTTTTSVSTNILVSYNQTPSNPKPNI